MELGPPDAYRGTRARVQVQELLNRPPGSIAKALPGHDAPRIAAENAGAWMVALCESA